MCAPKMLMGEFTDVNGTIYFDEDNVENSRVNLEITAKKANYNVEYHKGNPLVEIINGPKLLQTSVFPTIKFESTEVKKTSDFTGLVKGDMTLVGATFPFELDVTFDPEFGMTTEGRQAVSFVGSGKFERSDFNVNYGLDRIGIRKMGDQVQVLFSVVANKIK